MEYLKNFIKNSSLFAKIAVVLLPILIIVAIIAIIIFTSTPSIDSNVKVSDFDTIVDAPQNYKNEIEKRIWDYIKKNDYYSDDADFEAKVREGTYKKDDSSNIVKENFIVDIDALHYSFDVDVTWPKNKNVTEDLSITIACPHYLDIIYTDTKCIIESPMQQIKRYLPHYEKIGGMKYATIYKQYNGEEYLQVEVPACGDTALIENAVDTTKQWVKTMYLDPNDYTIKTVDVCNG